MRRVKGCINEACIANKKEKTYKVKDDYCSKCGNKLYYVCKKCYTQLDKDSKNYCIRCFAEKKDQNNNAKKIGVKVFALGVPAVGVGKKFIEVIKDLPK